MEKHCLIKTLLLTGVMLFLVSGNATACTSVCLAKNGHVVFGNNLDWYIADGYIFINKRGLIDKSNGENPTTY